MSEDEFADGFALWQEHKPQSGEDWIAVAKRCLSDETFDVSKSSPLFAGLFLLARDNAALVARAEAAEKEAEMYRREAAHARTLASGWAEANAERAAKNLHNDARKIAEARCVTLEAALRDARGRLNAVIIGWREHIDHDVIGALIALDAALAAATPPAEEEVVAAASVLGLSREETDELVRLVRSEGATTPPAEKEGT